VAATWSFPKRTPTPSSTPLHRNFAIGEVAAGLALANALETLARATMLRTASHVKLH